MIEVAAGGLHSVALRDDGTVWTWGRNNVGQLGYYPLSNTALPGQVTGIPEIVSIASGTDHVLALAADGEIWSWGWDGDGRTGRGFESGDVKSPDKVVGGHRWAAVAAGYCHSVGLRRDGTIWAWGCNESGGLGDNGSTLSRHPRRVCNDASWSCFNNRYVAIAAGTATTMAIRDDGIIWTFGLNAKGELAVGSNTNQRLPVNSRYTTSLLTVSNSAMPAANVTLSGTDGSTYWSHYGLGSATSYNRKAITTNVSDTVLPAVPNFIRLPVGTATAATRFTNGIAAYGWSSGTPTNSASNTTNKTGVAMAGLNRGFRLVLPAYPTPMTLKLYVGVDRASGRLSVSMSDGSVPAVIKTLSNTSGISEGVYTIAFAAGSSGKTLQVEWTNTAWTGSVRLSGASLR